jgi:hypothetical protein
MKISRHFSRDGQSPYTGIDFDADVDKLARPQRLAFVAEGRLVMDRPGRGVHLVVDEGEDAGMTVVRRTSARGRDRERATRRVFLHCGEVLLWHRKGDVNGPDLQDRHERRVVVGLHQVSSPQVDAPRAAGNRSGDRAVGEVEPRLFRHRLVGLDRGRLRCGQRGGRFVLLPRHVFLVDELRVAGEIPLGLVKERLVAGELRFGLLDRDAERLRIDDEDRLSLDQVGAVLDADLQDLTGHTRAHRDARHRLDVADRSQGNRDRASHGLADDDGRRRRRCRRFCPAAAARRRA